jgi:hypothetical protein
VAQVFILGVDNSISSKVIVGFIKSDNLREGIKMVKKSLIAIALMSFLATTVMAGDKAQNPWKFDDNWPHIIIYDELEICQIPIYMDVGHFVQLKDCGDRKIVLLQVPCADIGKDAAEFPCYHDCEDIEVRANFDVKLGVKLYKIGDVIDDDKWTAYYQGGDVITGDGNYHTATLCVDAWSANIYMHPPGDEVLVGEVAVTVKPN